MYMDWAYPGHGIISRSNQKLFEAWNREDPIDDWERERARRIEAIQGNRNPFIWGEIPADHPITPAVVASDNGAIVGNRPSENEAVTSGKVAATASFTLISLLTPLAGLCR
jgi:Endonuclease I